MKLFNLLKFLIKYLLFNMKLLPNKYKGEIDLYYAQKIFKKRSLKKINNQYWRINPMISKNELNLYYAKSYWSARGGIKNIVHDRDINHFKLLTDNLFLNDNKNLKVLNFGSGHGGISHLFHASGSSIYNIEPNGGSTYYEQRWKNFDNLDEVNEIFDIVYASHSLEHVSDINEVMIKLSSLMSNETYIFVEVPNCQSHKNRSKYLNGGSDGKIVIPHTYYFTTDFFKSFKSQNIICATFDAKTFHQYEDDSGNVIRYLGKGKPC